MRKIILALMILSLASPAFAQGQKPKIQLPIDPLGLNQKSLTGGTASTNLLQALDDKLLPDLLYAKKLSDASGNKITGTCYQSWIDIIQKRKTAVTNADGTPMDLPQPRIITDFEKAVELRNALQPESDFMIACSPVANMVKQDMIKFIGVILGGGISLSALGIGL